jgi:hypothetical protein
MRPSGAHGSYSRLRDGLSLKGEHLQLPQGSYVWHWPICGLILSPSATPAYVGLLM